MGHRRLKVAAISDDEDDDDMLPLTRVTRATSNGDDKANQRKRKGVLEEIEEEEIEELINDAKTKKKKKKSDENEEHEEEEEEEERGRGKRIKKLKKVEEDELEFESEPEPAEEEEETLEDAKPIGEVIRVTGKGKNRRNHYESFEYDGNRYELEDSVLLVAEEDPVLLVPEKKNQKPYVAIIKDITQTKDGNMMVTGQWFYRPEEAQKKTGGNWQSRDARELFYSFHRDEVPAESVMHKCVVHFIPLNKQIPSRKEHPGFIVQKVYDTDLRMLFRLTDKDYEDTKQHEIDLLVQKTMARVGHLPDIETEDNAAPPVGQEDQLKSKRLLRKKSMAALDVTREDDGPTRLGHSKAETPGSCANLEYSPILSKFKVLTGEMQRDRWVEKLMNAVKFLCNHVDSVQNEAKEKECSEGTDPTGNSGSAEHVNKSLENGANGNMFQWPDSVVPAVAALEKAAHEALSSDFQKYNQKMRQLNFNLKYEALARRLLNGELDPSQILNMSPNELKEGLTAEEIASREPEEPEPVQMTDARCKRCTEKKVRLREIIQAGHGDRYQLECIPCGNIWYAPRDEVASLTIDGPNFSKSVGTEPLATAKFENVEKKLTSPKGANDVLKKTTEAFMPVLDKQRSFNKSKQEDITTSTTNVD